jgi:hypothetical protein
VLPSDHRLVLSASDVRQWARLLDDANPLHQDEGGTVVPGPALLAMVLSAARTLSPESRVARVTARFTVIVEAPAVATVRFTAGSSGLDTRTGMEVVAVVMVEDRQVFRAALTLAPAGDTAGGK